MWKNGLLILGLFFLVGCSTASSHRQQVMDEKGDRLTVGKVQKEIRVGMSGAEVVEALGSPNMVSTDENRLEVWVYDKFATNITQSSSEGGLWLILAGVGGSSGSASQSQRTLTVVVKFDADKRVRDFAYHSSSF